VASLQLLLEVFAANILPIFLIAGVGMVIARQLAASASVVSHLVLNALIPCLVFNLLVTSQVSALELAPIALVCILVTAFKGVAAYLAARPLGLDRPARVGLMLAAMFSNAGNYGLPVTLFAFGREALTFATAYFVTSSILTYTVGMVLAASGRRSARESVRGLIRVPTIYAAAAAIAVLVLDAPLPGSLMRPIGLLSDAALPMMMLVLGMQLASGTRPERPLALAAVVALSLVLSPLVGFGLAQVLALEGAALQATVVQAAMPVAVVTSILALEFNVAPNFVTSAVLASTVLSPFTLTWLIAYLQRVA